MERTTTSILIPSRQTLTSEGRRVSTTLCGLHAFVSHSLTSVRRIMCIGADRCLLLVMHPQAQAVSLEGQPPFTCKACASIAGKSISRTYGEYLPVKGRRRLVWQQKDTFGEGTFSSNEGCASQAKHETCAASARSWGYAQRFQSVLLH